MSSNSTSGSNVFTTAMNLLGHNWNTDTTAPTTTSTNNPNDVCIAGGYFRPYLSRPSQTANTATNSQTQTRNELGAGTSNGNGDGSKAADHAEDVADDSRADEEK
ncbi:uncharacterized protein IL334_003877 [Kwoniella shivajii]|uniref:Uncharacterized protein n=1 Tax=Kwoniella shivajii TaxID=564305 RepID=A0ABZ1D2W5_9TREE|nr:hypothetical protein IL334_003877 [Kwoniella shivajii]